MEAPASLAAGARTVVATSDLGKKVAVARRTAALWFDRSLSLRHPPLDPPVPSRPGRPEKPELRAPRDMPRRSADSRTGHIALLHSIAHIELNAIDLAWDIVGRFADRPMPRAFFDDWVTVGLEESIHFELLCGRLADLGSWYGALPAHDGLWQAAEETGHDLTARLAIVPLVLEARGLDVTPSMIEKADARGDEADASVLRRIYEDEKKHVHFGVKWFKFLCEREGRPFEPTFHALVRKHFRSPLKPPFNDRARSEAGLTPGFYRPLEIIRT
ncbi:ferritin-like domain-containing protein [Amorphus orientalis]|uniref:Uncharacterized ferritin-like protein (DUF455 family) n=1 Tax=Amorphus orientalis TaxID=649198 RepID=A0AAE3VT46_9HYPH|nr:ferritin-like domain-containing protein [Amorphus orientalis]MDQ0317705.1 uncharacterized ferritin-like protein (DUF455 family) [Amorphus orientalis]